MAKETEGGALYESCDPTPFDHDCVPERSRTKGLRVFMFQATSALALASRLTPACISAQALSTTTALSKVYIEGGKIVLMSISDRSPRHSQPYGFQRRRSWVARSAVLGSSYSFAWAHGVVTGVINADETVEGWGLGDTIPRAQIGWTSGAWSNTFYLTGWLPTGRYQRGFEPNTGKNRYGVNLGWGITYTEPRTKLEFLEFMDRRDL